MAHRRVLRYHGRSGQSVGQELDRVVIVQGFRPTVLEQ